MVRTHHRAQVRSVFEYAYGRAPRRGRDTPSFAKMFCRCRATVCSLITSSTAMSRFVLPAATSRRTSASRAVSPAGSAPGLPQQYRASRRRSGAQPLEARERGAKLEPRPVFVAGGAERAREHAPGRAVSYGQPQLLPSRSRARSGASAA